MKFIILGIFALMLCIGCEAQSRVAFVSFVVRYNFQNQVDGTTDMTINAAFLPHPISNTIQGSNLWRLGFFGAQNAQGTGLRANQINQLLTPVQASRTVTPGQNLTFVVNARPNLNGIGPGKDFPYYCVEFGKNPGTNPNFIFQVGNDVKSAVLCQSSEDLPSEIRESKPRALFTTMSAEFRIVQSFDDRLPSRTTISIDLVPHPSTDTISGTNLWRLGFFGSKNSDGSGQRMGEYPQLLLPFQSGKRLAPDSPFSISVERFLSLANIGSGKSFPYLCIEFGKADGANPDFLFLGSEDGQTIILCQTADGTEEPQEATQTCPDGYIGAETTGMCYKRLEDPLAFDDARAACQADGADLASASTPAKNTIVSGLASGQRCWVGAIVEAGNYEWLNGDQWQYANWRKREPNYHLTGRACIETNFVQPYLWNDHYCTSKRIAVCEKAMTTA
ncbi:Galactose-specific lectin nattectin [Holothuria leucospilota]|uniref:Galactose-specific lectin nattectin n=1 Tax=Holothuria leucospilota TaxID=206669 RepID=A0A9Q1CCI0_HOLLE|nr:Galactose-specific lectin nattectin [Holothuria leucospilota]